MKRLLLTAISLITLGLSTHAQIRIAIEGGVHQSKVIENNSLPNWEADKQNYKGRTGVHVGFIADIPFSEKSKFFLQPGVIYHNKGREYQLSKDSTLVYPRPSLPDSTFTTFYSVNRKQYVNYVDIPLNLVYKFTIGRSSRFIIGAGPYLSFFYSGSQKDETLVSGISYNSEENEDLPVGKEAGQYRTVDYGVGGLAGFEFNRVFITANYSRGLGDFYEPADYTAKDYKHQVMGATIGVYLGKMTKPAPKDTDGDGVPDKLDKCPSVAGLKQFNGCPDTDNDGIADAQDGCPGQAGPLENKGCPWPDTDGDGVADKDDQCPDKAGPLSNKGCPTDTDNDGVIDSEDKCPDIAGLAKYQGCPVPDRDHDGINDELDACPDVAGVMENNGCPAIKKEVIEKANYAAQKIQFKVSSAELTRASLPVLDTVARLLQDNPELKVIIAGHTSAEGKYETNMKLSESRAETVRKYLVSRGVSESRLTAIGYGPDKPLNEGRTPEEKAKNRRVELQLSNQ